MSLIVTFKLLFLVYHFTYCMQYCIFNFLWLQIRTWYIGEIDGDV